MLKGISLQRLKRHSKLGFRWIRCGWRLFLRNPWLLGGMGMCCSAAAAVIVQVPLVGSPFLGLLAPTAIASFYLAVDGISRQKTKLPAALRFVAVKQSPREFMNVAREDHRLMQVLVMGLYSLVVVVLTDILVWFVAGTVLASPLGGLTFAGLVGVGFATLLRLAIYLLLAASLVYTLPLALLQNQALVPALLDSIRRALHYGIALLVIVLLLLAPLFFGAIVSFYSKFAGYLVGFVAGVIALPVSVCGLYCSYRTVFPDAEPAQAIHADFKRANYV